MQFLNSVRLWQKLALLVVAMAVPTALLGVFYLSGANAQVALASNEIEGAHYVQSVGAVLAEAANHRSRLFALLTGDAERRDEVSSSETEMAKLVAEESTQAMPRSAPSSACPEPGAVSSRRGNV